MPMASDQERAYEAPGLRVGSSAWKWPPVWPYDRSFFVPKEDLITQGAPDLASMAGMMNGVPQIPTVGEAKEVSTFDVISYWNEELANVATELDPEAAENLKNHYGFYLEDGMTVLELGAAEESYLPDDLKLARHVGVGASKSAMERNSALTESMVVDLNNVVEEEGINSEELERLAAVQFDAILMANTVDFLTSPREVYKTAWSLLKPGGIMIVAFSNKDAYKSKFERAQTKMWRDFNDDQHMWVCGSFFQFSAGDGWMDLKGFDISPEGAKDNSDTGPFSFLKGGKNNNIYVVQAKKGFQEEKIDESNPEKYFKSKMWMLPIMEERDKTLVTPRLRRAYEYALTEKEKEAIERNVDHLPSIYESLIKMDQFAFTFNMQAQLAVDLVVDEQFNGNDEQLTALKQGLGLKIPSEEFWAPIGQLTAAMDAEEKINLLAHLVPRFGSGDPEQEIALQTFVTGLKPTFTCIRSKCPDLSEADVQLLGSELLAAEVLKPGRSTREEFAAWLGTLNMAEMQEILAARKRVKDEANAQLEEFRTRKIEEAAREEAERNAIKEQVEAARKERSLVFNPKTGKLEPLPDKKK